MPGQKFLTSGCGASHMTAVCLLLLLTVVSAGFLAVSLSSFSENADPLSETYHARIRVDEIRGGLSSGSSPVRFKDNIIILKHEGGDPVPPEAVSVIFRGTGNAYHGIPGTAESRMLTGNIEIIYENLGRSGKNSEYASRNNDVLADGLWSAGEIIILTGNDSVTGSVRSAGGSGIRVSVDGEADTSCNFGLKNGTSCRYDIIIRQNGRAAVLAEGEISVRDISS